MDDLQAYIDRIRQKYKLPALAVAVARDGQPDLILASGVRKVGSDVPVTVDDKFHLGSCAKAATAALIHKLIGEGKMKMSDRLEDLLPGFDIHPGYRDVTIANLLTHTSGLPRDEGYLKDPPAYPRGEHYYSNVGYMLLGQLACHVSNNKPFGELIKQEIFDPLGMNHIGFGMPADSGAALPDQPWGHVVDYETDEWTPVHKDNPESWAGAGTLHATLGDWLTFLKFELKQRRLAEPHTAVNDQFGNYYNDSAFFQELDGTFSHVGTNMSQLCGHALMPDQGAAIMVACNAESDTCLEAINEVIDHVKQRIVHDHALEQANEFRRADGRTNTVGASI